jgi:hypothetical protein
MAKGVHLSLMVGPVVPVPVPKDVIDALTSVEVTTAAGQRSGFQLTFSMSVRSPLQTIFLLAGGALAPIIRVIIVATVNGSSQVLMDGVMTNTEVSQGETPGTATLTITGQDLTAIMDQIDFSGFPYPAMPAEARVAICIAKYAVFGMIPIVIPSVLIDVPIPIERIPRHQGTDLAYIKQLADEVGYTFYIDPGPEPGVNRAYWGPEIKAGAPQKALNVDMDAHTNVESINFRFDNEKATLPIVWIQIPQTKTPIPIPIPPITPFSPPLGLLPPIPKKIEPIPGLANKNPIQALLIGMAKAAKSQDAVTATGSLDVLRYGRPLNARQLVGVRGAGTAFDGLYYVKSVTHRIKRGDYKQSFTLTRNGLISTFAKVPA